MDSWMVCNNNPFDWISDWNKWKFKLFTVGYNAAYNKDNKNKRTLIRRP